jgi:hypothetical protein
MKVVCINSVSLTYDDEFNSIKGKNGLESIATKYQFNQGFRVCELQYII